VGLAKSELIAAGDLVDFGAQWMNARFGGLQANQGRMWARIRASMLAPGLSVTFMHSSTAGVGMLPTSSSLRGRL
jgi:hypothetical protein